MNLVELPAKDGDGALRAIIETPRGSTVKIKYEPGLGIFEFGRPLVLGVVYPFDWGFIPSTLAPDGDPLDVMVVHDASTYPGVVIPTKPIGVVRVSQRVSQRKKKSGRERNDRVIAVPAYEPRFEHVDDVGKRTKKELEEFFVSAVLLEDKAVRIEGWGGPEEARLLVRKAEKARR
jgi:inorganic pyrophosphatase